MADIFAVSADDPFYIKPSTAAAPLPAATTTTTTASTVAVQPAVHHQQSSSFFAPSSSVAAPAPPKAFDWSSNKDLYRGLFASPSPTSSSTAVATATPVVTQQASFGPASTTTTSSAWGSPSWGNNNMGAFNQQAQQMPQQQQQFNSGWATVQPITPTAFPTASTATTAMNGGGWAAFNTPPQSTATVASTSFFQPAMQTTPAAAVQLPPQQFQQPMMRAAATTVMMPQQPVMMTQQPVMMTQQQPQTMVSPAALPASVTTPVMAPVVPPQPKPQQPFFAPTAATVASQQVPSAAMVMPKLNPFDDEFYVEFAKTNPVVLAVEQPPARPPKQQQQPVQLPPPQALPPPQILPLPLPVVVPVVEQPAAAVNNPSLVVLPPPPRTQSPHHHKALPSISTPPIAKPLPPPKPIPSTIQQTEEKPPALPAKPSGHAQSHSTSWGDLLGQPTAATTATSLNPVASSSTGFDPFGLGGSVFDQPHHHHQQQPPIVSQRSTSAGIDLLDDAPPALAPATSTALTPKPLPGMVMLPMPAAPAVSREVPRQRAVSMSSDKTKLTSTTAAVPLPAIPLGLPKPATRRSTGASPPTSVLIAPPPPRKELPTMHRTKSSNETVPSEMPSLAPTTTTTTTVISKPLPMPMKMASKDDSTTTTTTRVPTPPPPRPMKLATADSLSQMLAGTVTAPLIPIPPEPLKQFRRLYNQANPVDGKITSDAVRRIWLSIDHSGDQDTLRKIYDLAKRSKEKGLSEAEFIMGMQLVTDVNNGLVLPASISEITWSLLESQLPSVPPSPLVSNVMLTVPTETTPTTSPQPPPLPPKPAFAMTSSENDLSREDTQTEGKEDEYEEEREQAPSVSRHNKPAMLPLDDRNIGLAPSHWFDEGAGAAEGSGAGAIGGSSQNDDNTSTRTSSSCVIGASISGAPSTVVTPPPVVRPRSYSASPTQLTTPNTATDEKSISPMPAVDLAFTPISASYACQWPDRKLEPFASVEAFMEHFKFESPAVRDMLTNYNLGLADLLEITEDTLVPLGVTSITDRFALYHAVWLSHKFLPAPRVLSLSSSTASSAGSAQSSPAESQDFRPKLPPRKSKASEEKSSKPTATTNNSNNKDEDRELLSPGLNDGSLLDNKPIRSLQAPKITLRGGVTKLTAPPPLILHQSKLMDDKKNRSKEEAERDAAAPIAELFTGYRVRLLFQERRTMRRRCIEELAEMFANYIKVINTFRTLILDTAREKILLSDDRLAALSPLLDTAEVCKVVLNSLNMLLKSWTVCSCVSDVMLGHIAKGKWRTAFLVFLNRRGQILYSFEDQLISKKKKMALLKPFESKLNFPVIGIFDKPSQLLNTLESGVAKLLSFTHPGHPDSPSIESLFPVIHAMQEEDKKARDLDIKARYDISKLTEISTTITSPPKDFVAYGRTFVMAGEIYELKPDGEAALRKYIMLNDCVLMSKQLKGGNAKGKFVLKYATEFDAITLRNLEDGTSVFGKKVYNAWAVNTGGESLVYYMKTSEEKKQLFSDMYRTIEKHKTDTIKRRESEANLLTTGF